MKTNKANANENANANKVNNESANVTNNVSDNNANANVENVESNESTNNVESNESNATTTEPTAEQIAAARVETKHQKEIGDRYAPETPKEVERTKFVGATVLIVYRPTGNRKNSDKTFYQIYFNGTIYDGYSATEFCDAVGIERKHRNGNTPKVTTLLDKLQALKNAIEAIGSEEDTFINFAKIVTAKIESEKLESDRIAFVAKYESLISALPYLTTAVATTLHGEDFVKMALKLGYKFADTPTDKPTDTTDTTDTNESK